MISSFYMFNKLDATFSFISEAVIFHNNSKSHRRKAINLHDFIPQLFNLAALQQEQVKESRSHIYSLG